MAAVLACAPARAADLAIDHPFIGTWKLPIAQLNCTETYLFLRDGTSRVTSAEEISESRYEISPAPSASGFYRWTDTIVKNNGKKDCSGSGDQGRQDGHAVRAVPPLGNIFFICQEEKRNTCFGPFYRQRGQDT